MFWKDEEIHEIHNRIKMLEKRMEHDSNILNLIHSQLALKIHQEKQKDEEGVGNKGGMFNSYISDMVAKNNEVLQFIYESLKAINGVSPVTKRTRKKRLKKTVLAPEA